MNWRGISLSLLTILIVVILILIQCTREQVPALRKDWGTASGLSLLVILAAGLPFPYWLARMSQRHLISNNIVELSARIYVTLVCSLVYVPFILLLTQWGYAYRIIQLRYWDASRLFLATFAAGLIYARVRRRALKIPVLLSNSAMPVLLFYAIYISVASAFPLSIFEIDALLPIGLAVHYFNTGAVAFANDRPVDFGKILWDGQRLLGDGVSVRGTMGGLLTAFLCGFAAVGCRPVPLLIGGFSGMLGDAMGSFVKRRFALPSGSQVPVLDQLGAILPILLLSTFSDYLRLNLRQTIVLALSTLLLPIFGNLYLFITDQKRVPW